MSMRSASGLSIAMASSAAFMPTASCQPSSTWSTMSRRISRTMKRSLHRRVPTPLPSHEEHAEGANNATAATNILTSLAGGPPLSYSACSVQGERSYMEDEYVVEHGGRFAAVCDGHGGRAVSRYLRQNLYASFQAALPASAAMVTSAAAEDGEGPDLLLVDCKNDTQSTVVDLALKAAFRKVDSEVCRIGHWSFQGSTCLAVVIHENKEDGSRAIVSANVGDSRAVLCRRGVAVDLTKDHKPNDPEERARIEAQGGTVEWCGTVDPRGRPVERAGVWRINGNLALSRAIGDRSEKTWVASSVDVARHPIEEGGDAFVLLATDGLFDVMTSQEVVTFVNEIVESAAGPPETDMAKHVVEEALSRGSTDNITVLILWINKENKVCIKAPS